MSKTVYKVVSRARDGRLRSALVRGEACVYYEQGKPATGCEGTPVYAFEYETGAKWWARDFPISQSQVWKAQADVTRQRPSRLGLGVLRALKCVAVVSFWRRYGRRPDNGLAGAVVCTSLTLVERVP